MRMVLNIQTILMPLLIVGAFGFHEKVMKFVGVGRGLEKGMQMDQVDLLGLFLIWEDLIH